jgi:hypothetical protein
MRLELIPLLVALGVVALDAQPACRPSRFGGEVSHGQAFEHALAPDLVFRLAPEGHPANPPGWRVEVRSRALPEPENELSSLVTPPYRSWNPRYLDTSYGWSARDAVNYGPREFRFVTPATEYRAAVEAVRALLWPSGIAEADARRTLDSVCRATGRLVILDARVDEKAVSQHGGPGRIEWLLFEVEVCLP